MTGSSNKVLRKKTVGNPAPSDHNDPPETVEEEASIRGGDVMGGQLLQFIKAVEDLEEEKRDIADAVKDIYDHAKATGFDVKTMRRVVAIRKKDSAAFEEEEALITEYRHAIEDI